MNVSNFVTALRAARPINILPRTDVGISESEFRNRCDGQMVWHSVDLGSVFVEGSRKTSEILYAESLRLQWPDLKGKTVLDVGAFGGWYSFEAERRGASRVVALDWYSWVVDNPRLAEWAAAERAAGRIPDVYSPPPEVTDLDLLPGRKAFDVTREILGSTVEPVVSLFEDYNSSPYDFVLFLGVLYHSHDPIGTLRHAAELASECLIVETLGVHIPGCEDEPYWEFYHGDAVNADVTTWWAPNEEGLRAALQSCGFKHIEISGGFADLTDNQLLQKSSTRIWAHAYRNAPSEASSIAVPEGLSLNAEADYSLVPRLPAVDVDIDRLRSLFAYQPFVLPDGSYTGAYELMIQTVTDMQPAEQLAQTHQDLLDGAHAALGTFRGLDVIDFASNAGFMCLRALQMGAASATGVDLAVYSEAFKILNQAFDVKSRFIPAPYSFMRHEFEGMDHEKTYDLVISSAFMCHSSDPTFLLSALARKSHDALLLFTSITPEADLTITFSKSLGRYFGEPFPACFDAHTSISEGLLRVGLEQLGFKSVTEIPRKHYWLPEDVRFRAFVARRKR